MNINNSINLMLSIYENYNMGHISKDECEFLIYEMKSRSEYARRHFVKMFSFIETPRLIDDDNLFSDPSIKHGFILFENWATPVDILTDDTLIVNGKEVIGEIQTSLSSGKIILNSKILLRLKSNRFRDAVICHELGHSKLHNQLAIPDPTMNHYVLVNIVCDIINAQANSPKLKNYTDYNDYAADYIRGWYSPLYSQYVRKLQNSSLDERATILSEYRQQCIDKFREYDMGTHANPMEFEADRFSANRVGTQTLIKALKRVSKEALKIYKRQYEKSLENERLAFNRSSKNFLCKKIYDANIKQLKTNYYNYIRQNKIDIEQRIKALTDIDILMNDKFRNVY